MKKKMKILFLLPNFYMGGAEKVTINLIRALDKDLFEVHLVVMNIEGPLYDLLPKDTILHVLNVSRTFLSIFKLRKVLVNVEPKIVFSTLFRTHTALDMAMLGLKKRPILVLRNPTSPKLITEENSLSFIRKFFLIKSYKNANLVLSQTPEMKEEMVEYFNVKENKIQVFINPLDIASINKGINNIKNPFDPNYINVVAAGRLDKVKDFVTLLKSFKIVVERNNKFILNIIGRDAGEKDRLIKLMYDLSLEDNVKFLGEQSNPYRYFYFSDLHVLSSIREGLPNTVLENLYLKKPIIATKCIPFMSQLIDDGNNGYLVEVGDIESLAKAILKYKNIDTETKYSLLNQSNVNQLFVDIKENI